MNRNIISILIAGTGVLLVSLTVMYAAIFFFPTLMEEYYNAVFRSSSFETDWLFYVHPFIVSAAFLWFWKQFKDRFEQDGVARVILIAVAYSLVAIIPVLWLTFSAIDISVLMVFTWVAYGFVQSLIAAFVYNIRHP